jgi:hypothetical protein
MKRLPNNGYRDLDLNLFFIMNKEKKTQQRGKKRMDKTKEAI